MTTTNGSNSATAARRVVSGKSLAHRKLDKRQLAILAADLVDGVMTIQLTMRQVARLLGVSENYIRIAQRFSPAKRAAILAGRDSTSFAVLLNPSARCLALPAPKQPIIDWAGIDDATLSDVVRAVGIDRALAAAVAVEHATA
jgi:hypothetical protein